MLGDKNYQLSILDILAGNNALLGEYRAVFEEYTALSREVRRMKEVLEESRRDEEWLRFQLDELDNAKLKEGELEELEQEGQEERLLQLL